MKREIEVSDMCNKDIDMLAHIFKKTPDRIVQDCISYCTAVMKLTSEVNRDNPVVRGFEKSIALMSVLLKDTLMEGTDVTDDEIMRLSEFEEYR